MSVSETAGTGPYRKFPLQRGMPPRSFITFNGTANDRAAVFQKLMTVDPRCGAIRCAGDIQTEKENAKER